MITICLNFTSDLEDLFLAKTSKCDKRLMETETTAKSEFPNGRKAIAEQILASEERKKSKRVGL